MARICLYEHRLGKHDSLKDMIGPMPRSPKELLEEAREMETHLRGRYPYASEAMVMSVAGQLVRLGEDRRLGRIDDMQHETMSGNVTSLIAADNRTGEMKSFILEDRHRSPAYDYIINKHHPRKPNITEIASLRVDKPNTGQPFDSIIANTIQPFAAPSRALTRLAQEAGDHEHRGDFRRAQSSWERAAKQARLDGRKDLAFEYEARAFTVKMRHLFRN